MLAFSVLLLGPLLVQGVQLGELGGLNFDVNQEYATSYEDYKPSDYQYGYGVSDPHTGDHKSHWEVKENGVVRGEYSLLEPDGTTRIVQYTADDHNGFRATVKKIGHAVHPPSGFHVPVRHDIQALPAIPQDHHSENYYKTYDGSIQNYANTLPVHAPYQEGLTYQQLPLVTNNVHTEELPLPYTVTGNHIASGIEPVRTLNAEPYRTLNILPSQKLNNIHLPPIETIAREEYQSGYAEQPAYIPESTPLHYRKDIPLPLQIQEPINLPPIQEPVSLPHFISENKEHVTPLIHLQSGVSYTEGNYQKDLHSSVIEPLNIGLRIDHPHGESSSSFHGQTGNIEDDSTYTSYGNSGAILGW